MFNTIKATRFWTWFKKNNRRYLNIFDVDKKESQRLINELQLRVEDFNPQLVCEVAVDKKNSHGFLVISAGRDRRYFETAKILTARAPSLAGWDFFALRPPRAIDFMFEEEQGHTGIDPHQLRFSTFSENEGSPVLDAIYVHIPGCKPGDDDFYLPAAEHVLENLVGEEVFVTVLGLVVPIELTEPDLRCRYVYPIQQLPAFVDAMPSAYMVNKEGKIYLDSV